jgi:hypothetical protein
MIGQRKIRHTCACLAVMLGVAALGPTVMGCAPGAPTGEPTGEPTAEDLVARHLEALGGAEQLEAIETLSMSGRAKARPGQEALVTREVRPPGRIRTEFSHQGVTAVFACDGTDCWYVDPMAGVFDAEPMLPEEAKRAIDSADVLGIIDFQAKGHSAELLGTETIDGRETFKLRVTSAREAEYVTYLDAESALLVREVTTRTIRGRTVELVTDFADFRPVDGIVFPHSIRSHAQGRDEVLEVVVEKIEINAPIDDARFEMPGAGSDG